MSSNINNSKIKRNKTPMAVFALMVAFVIAGTYTYQCLHTDREKVHQATAQIKVYTHYTLVQGDRTILDFAPDTTTAVGYFARSWALLPTCQGRICANIDSRAWQNPYAHANVAQLMKKKMESLDSIYKESKWKVSELNYYLRSHSVTDEGYATISQYAEKETRLRDSAQKMLDSLKHFQKDKKLHIVAHHDIVAFFQGGKVKVNRLSEGTYQLATQKTPQSVVALPDRLAKGLARVHLVHQHPLPTLCFELDSITHYEGDMDSELRPHGHGYAYDDHGVYYEGSWVHGKRDGFGFSISGKKPLRAGEWKNDRYKGERMVYSSDRIYGIDISKYQHVIGKKKYGIDWKRLRITHLGNISRKTINGEVNYPISFIYIKSTEGATLLNPYYRQDYLSARARGFKVGSYHFFSTRSSGALQARQFLKHSIVQKGDFPPVLDVEPTHDQIQKMGGTGVLFARVRTWLRFVERETGVKPILYISQTFVNRYLNLAPDLKHNYQIWIARYGEYKPDIHLIYWQLCPDGRVAGIHGHVDINVFNGYRDAFERFAETHRTY